MKGELREFRVTKVYEGLFIGTTVTVSMRVDATDHSAASKTMSIHTDYDIFANKDNWKVIRICVQDQEQIDAGDITVLEVES